ncbi:MAG TPA: peroxiredoxin [Thermoanaerobaculia bacterium]|nr:peroxiredoxin [Thermoanaerobaculia bacterium]
MNRPLRLPIALVVFAALFAAAAPGGADGAPAVGSPAPAFTLTSNEGKPTSLADFKGKWVVLYFYPKDFTSGCTVEAHNFQRDLAQYEKINAVILGVSVDSAGSHKDFCAKEGLAFKLLSDPDAKVSTEYGSVMTYQGSKLSARNTFLIDPQGKIAKVFIGVKPSAHSEEVLAALASLQKA